MHCIYLELFFYFMCFNNMHLSVLITVQSVLCDSQNHSKILLLFCRGPAPADPGYSKERRHKRGSGNNCLITL